MGIDDVLRKRTNIDYSEPALEIDATPFFQVVESRRSVRVFEPTPIPEAVMHRCLDAALLAPNSSNLQAWEFHWVRSPEKKAALVEACLGQPAASTAAELVVFVARTGTWKDMRKRMLALFAKDNKAPASVVAYYDKLIPLVMEQGPLGVVGLAKKAVLFTRGLKRATPREPTSQGDVKLWAVKSCALACENYMLAMRALGFDTCPMEGFDSTRVKALLGLPSDAAITMVFSAGKRAEGGVYGPRIRFDRALFVKEH